MDKKNKLFALIMIVIGIFFEFYMYFQLVSTNAKINNVYKFLFLGLCIATNIFCFIAFLIIKRKEKLKQEIVFLVVSICFGVIYLIFIPSMLGTDELPHFLRSYQISVGDVIVKHPEKDSTLIPKSLSEITSVPEFKNRYSKEKIFKATNYKDKVKIWNGNVTSIKYSPIPYLPQIAGFIIAKFLHLSPIFTLFCVRFSNFCVWLILGFFAMKLLPVKKTFATLLYTSPAVLSLVATCSGDAFALGIMFLMVAYILNLIKSSRKITKKDYIVLLLLALGLSTYKMFYVIFILLMLLIPNKSFKNLRHKLLFLGSIFILALLTDYLWFSLTSINSTIQNPELSKQLHFVLTHPIHYFMTFINTFFQDLYYYISNIVGGTEMCYGIVKLNQIFVIPYIIILVISYYDGEKNVKLNNISKIFILLICLLLIGLVSTALYLDWTSHKMGIGTNIIIGVQARYFIPLIIPIISILPNSKIKYNFKNNFHLGVLVLDALLVINTINSILIALSQT